MVCRQEQVRNRNCLRESVQAGSPSFRPRVSPRRALRRPRTPTPRSRQLPTKLRNALEGAYTTATKGVSSLGLKVLEIGFAPNANASFDHAISLFGAKTISDVIELNTAFLRKQTETGYGFRSRSFGELAQKVANETDRSGQGPGREEPFKTARFRLSVHWLDVYEGPEPCSGPFAYSGSSMPLPSKQRGNRHEATANSG